MGLRYCPQCKKHEKASKKLDLWKLPEVRFSLIELININSGSHHTFETLPIQQMEQRQDRHPSRHSCAVSFFPLYQTSLAFSVASNSTPNWPTNVMNTWSMTSSPWVTTWEDWEVVTTLLLLSTKQLTNGIIICPLPPIYPIYRYDFNDAVASVATPPPDPLIGKTPYMLVYCRRDPTPDGAHADSNFEMETDQ